MRNINDRLGLAFVAVLLWGGAVHAQTTSFTYQGRLTDGGTPANGNYDLQFALFDTVGGGAQIATQTSPNVLVSAGIFTVQLDFGATAFPGANRFLEIGARLTGAASFTTLSPRQQITSTPYAIRSLNASSADAVTVSGVPGGSGNYIQNATTQQAGANFNISGNGTAGGTLAGNVVNAATQYNINGLRALGTAGTSNLFAGISAGDSNTTGSGNAFFGALAGVNNDVGSLNTRIGFNTVGRNSALTNSTAIGANAQVDQNNSLVLGSIAGVNGASASVNVGIGTSVPAQELQVNGITSLGAPGSVYGYLVDGSSPGPYPTLGFNTYGTSYRAGVAGYGGIFQFQDGDGSLIYYTGSNVAAGAPYVNTARLAIDKDGNVGIGTATPFARLYVRGPGTSSTTVALRVDNSGPSPSLIVADDRTVQIFRLNGSSTTHACYTGNYYFAACSSAAEYVPTIDDGRGYAQAADLVSMAPSVKNPYDDEHSPFVVTKSAKPCDDNLLGFIVKPESGADGKKLNDHYLPLAIYGYFPAKVTLENGAIKRGDPITSSSKPGYGMKATQACKIVGYALEDTNKEGTIQVFARHGENAAPVVAALRARTEELNGTVEALKKDKAKQQDRNDALAARVTALEQAAQAQLRKSSWPTFRAVRQRGLYAHRAVRTVFYPRKRPS